MDQSLDILYRGGGCTRAVRRDEMRICTGKANVKKKDINLGLTTRNSTKFQAHVAFQYSTGWPTQRVRRLVLFRRRRAQVKYWAAV
jgi:hypothetical protein